jgi:hypothetical protein
MMSNVLFPDPGNPKADFNLELRRGDDFIGSRKLHYKAVVNAAQDCQNAV